MVMVGYCVLRTDLCIGGWPGCWYDDDDVVDANGGVCRCGGFVCTI